MWYALAKSVMVIKVLLPLLLPVPKCGSWEGGGGGGEKYIMLHFLRHKGVRCSADTGRSDGAGSGDGVLRPECANGHQMSWQLCGTKMRKESLELGDVSASRPRQARLPSPKQPRKELLRKQISSLPFPRSYCKQP